MTQKLSQLTAERLHQARLNLAESKVLVGFDGFVDTILHVVAKRESRTKFIRIEKMEDFSEKIRAAAGFSANFEFVTQMLKLGGNGPIIANALSRMSPPVTYIGNLGYPNIHPVFAQFSKTARVISIAEPGYTDAIEFDNGKLLFGKHDSLRSVDWKNLTKHIDEPALVQLFSDAAMIALVNWTMLTEMTSIFKKILSRIAPQLNGPKRWVFFDLADPAKRTRKDIAEVLRVITKFEKKFRVILGLNFNESRLIGETLGLNRPKETPKQVSEHAKAIREQLQIDTVVIHPTRFAAASDENEVHAVNGPYIEKPKITTGAGDHFNAGFCIGRLLNLDISMSLQLGVATSGYYVREAKSPDVSALIGFLKKL